MKIKLVLLAFVAMFFSCAHSAPGDKRGAWLNKYNEAYAITVIEIKSVCGKEENRGRTSSALMYVERKKEASGEIVVHFRSFNWSNDFDLTPETDGDYRGEKEEKNMMTNDVTAQDVGISFIKDEKGDYVRGMWNVGIRDPNLVVKCVHYNVIFGERVR